MIEKLSPLWKCADKCASVCVKGGGMTNSWAELSANPKYGPAEVGSISLINGPFEVLISAY